jgi:hypothetical protein
MSRLPNVERTTPDMLGPISGAEPSGLGLEITLPPSESTVIEMDDGSMEITLGPDVDNGEEGQDDFSANLVDTIDESELSNITQTVLTNVEQDENSRKDWIEIYKKGVRLMGLKYEKRTSPWNGACGVAHPMITEAVVRFQSETMMETFPAGGPVLTKVIGKETKHKLEAALRVRADMNYQITERMEEFRDEHDRAMFSLPAVGCVFKKIYRDPVKKRQVSMMVDADDLLLPYGATNVWTAPRVTHIMRYNKIEMEQFQREGFYKDCELGSPGLYQSETKEAKDEAVGQDSIHDDRFMIYEQQLWLYIESDEKNTTGQAVPYIATVCRDNTQIIGLRRNWKESGEPTKRCQHFVQYDYIPGFGPYGMGLFHLIGGYAEASTSIIRQLVDAGTLSNLPGGLKTKGLRVKGDDTPIRPGEFRDVDIGGGTMKDNIMPLPYKEPSVVLHALLKDLVEEGRRLPGLADMKVADMSAQAPVGTTLALIERQLKVMSAVQARVHASLKREFVLIKQGVVDHDGDKPYDYEPSTGVPGNRRQDYAMVEVIPVSDPNAATLTQRLVQYQAVIQLSQTAPQIYNLPLLHRGMLDVLGIKNADKLVPTEDDLLPLDPVTENQKVLKGEPIKAFLHQDHEAHLAVHMAAMQDPMLMQVMGQNPKAQQMMAAAQAHIAEHVGFLYRQKMQAIMGIEIPDSEETPLSHEQSAQLARMMAQGAQQLLQQNMAQQQQQQAQQQAQDPVLQIKMAELEIKKQQAALDEKRLALEEKRLAVDAAARADAHTLNEKRVAMDAAEKTDRQLLAEKKQQDDAELRESEIEVRAMHVGMMGRAQDQQLLMQDRQMAQQERQRLREKHDANNVGESSGS